MKKTLAFLLIVTMMIASFCSCNMQNSNAPDGLKIAKESERGEYIFYCPKSWTVVSTAEVGAARVSSEDSTSITFAEAEMPVHSLSEYFSDSIADFPQSIRDTVRVIVNGEEYSFGNADGECRRYIYTYKYGNLDVCCMQILVTNGNRFYIFTYTSFGNIEDGNSPYQKNLSKVNLSVSSFRFTGETFDEVTVEYEKDADGYNLVSKPSRAGFSLYIPDNYSVIFSDGFVKAKASDKANISLTKASAEGIGLFDYLKEKKEKMSRIVTDFTDVSLKVALPINDGELKNLGFDVDPVYDEKLCLGNLSKGSLIAYEYTYSMCGRSYHVLQILGIKGQNGFVFTYTATADEYEVHIDDITTILEKVIF